MFTQIFFEDENQNKIEDGLLKFCNNDWSPTEKGNCFASVRRLIVDGYKSLTVCMISHSLSFGKRTFS